MNRLSIQKRAQIVGCLVEGMSVRGVVPGRALIEVVRLPAGGWTVRARGIRTQALAIAAARKVGQTIEDDGGDAELVVKDRSGRIRPPKESYGRDSRRVPG